MKVLVLGAGGNLGRRLVVALASTASGPAPHTVVALVRSRARLPDDVATLCAAIIEGDAASSATVAAALRDHACDALAHAAGSAPMSPWADDMPLVDMFDAVLTAAETVGKERGGGEGLIRAWMVGDVAVMDAPWGGLLSE